MTLRAFALAAAFAAAGCLDARFSAYVETDIPHAHDDRCGHAWDGRRWVFIGLRHEHGPACGHWWHHGAWHVHPPDYAYPDSACGHFGVFVEEAHEHSDVCGHAWDGAAWRHEPGHVHGSSCAHHFHHGAWHVHPESHVYVDKAHGHFNALVKVEGAKETSFETEKR